MTTQIQTTAAMRRFNQVLEIADYRHSDESDCPLDLDLGRLYAWLQSNGYSWTASELKLAGQAVGYFKEVQ